MDLRRHWCNIRLPKLNPQLPFALILNKTNEGNSSMTSTSWEPGWSDVNLPGLDQGTVSCSRYVKETDTSSKLTSEAPADDSDHVSCQRFVQASVVVSVALVATTLLLATLDAPFKSDHAVSKPPRTVTFPHSVRGDVISANSDVKIMADDLAEEVATPMTADNIEGDVKTQPQDDQYAGEVSDIPSLMKIREETFRALASFRKPTYKDLQNSTDALAV
ncbi:hypothetical protein MTO96_022178 [Rhipicephalus appendiculatus]